MPPNTWASGPTFCAPTTNSYRRLVPGYEAPVNLVYSQRNRSACIRIPMYSESARAKRIEFRPPDSAANPYLAFAAMLMAGIDGIERGLDPGAPADYDLFEEANGDVPQVPGSLSEALEALEAFRAHVSAGEPDGSTAEGGSAPNGALDDIAGVCNERGNVFGLMPHPERVVDPLSGGTDGAAFFATIVTRLAGVAG